MKRTKSVNFNLSSDLYAKVEEYSKAHQIPIEEVIQMALAEYFDSGLLLEEEKKRKRIWDIIDVPEDDC
jgi:hypothetical protein